jgi:drug/metabolite transporter (DMT)-like permease
VLLSKRADRGLVSAPDVSLTDDAQTSVVRVPSPAETMRRENMRGILAMLAAMFFFVTNDMFVKLASETLPTAQIIVIRGGLAVLLIATLARMSGALRTWPKRGWRIMGLRSVGEIGGTLLYLTALFHMQIANATAILQAMPLVMTVLSALVLGEVVRWRRWAAVIAGFLGMLMVVQPGSDAFNVYALLAVASLAFASVRDLSSRFLPPELPSLFVALFSMIAVTCVGAVWAITEPWAPVSREVFVYLACAATLLTGAFYFITEAMRHGEVSVVAPFRYSIIIIALVLGYLVWGQLPDLAATAGIVFIVASGLYVFYRESRVHGAARTAAAGREPN